MEIKKYWWVGVLIVAILTLGALDLDRGYNSVLYNDFSGGINLFTDPANLQDNQATNIENLLFYGNRLRSRKSITDLNTTSLGSDPLDGIHIFQKVGEWSQILATYNGMIWTFDEGTGEFTEFMGFEIDTAGSALVTQNDSIVKGYQTSYINLGYGDSIPIYLNDSLHYIYQILSDTLMLLYDQFKGSTDTTANLTQAVFVPRDRPTLFDTWLNRVFIPGIARVIDYDGSPVSSDTADTIEFTIDSVTNYRSQMVFWTTPRPDSFYDYYQLNLCYMVSYNDSNSTTKLNIPLLITAMNNDRIIVWADSTLADTHFYATQTFKTLSPFESEYLVYAGSIDSLDTIFSVTGGAAVKIYDNSQNWTKQDMNFGYFYITNDGIEDPATQRPPSRSFCRLLEDANSNVFLYVFCRGWMLDYLEMPSVTSATTIRPPNGDEGTNDWASTGDFNYTEIDEQVSAVDTSDYIVTTVEGRHDCWTFQDLGDKAILDSVRLYVLHRTYDGSPYGDSSSCSLNIAVCIGDTSDCTWKGAFASPMDTTRDSLTCTTSPATGNAWTNVEIDDMLGMVKLHYRDSDSGNHARVFQAHMTVFYSNIGDTFEIYRRVDSYREHVPHYVTHWQDRQWRAGYIDDPNLLKWSESFDPDSFPSLYYAYIVRDDGDVITAIKVMPFQDLLMIYKNKHIYAMSTVGESPHDWWLHDLIDGIGTPAWASIINYGRKQYFYDYTGFYEFDATTPQKISWAIEPIIADSINKDYAYLIVGGYFDQHLWWSYPSLYKDSVWVEAQQNGGGESYWKYVMKEATKNNRTILYNLETGGWTKVDINSSTYFVGQIETEANGVLIGDPDSGRVYRYGLNYIDHGNDSIDAIYESPWFDCGDEYDLQKQFKDIQFVMSRGDSTIVYIDYYKDYVNTVIWTDTVAVDTFSNPHYYKRAIQFGNVRGQRIKLKIRIKKIDSDFSLAFFRLKWKPVGEVRYND